MNELITIEGFEKLTKQQVFDMSVKHVLKNGQPSIKAVPYVGFNGEKMLQRCSYMGIGCAAAPFIKEELREFADTANYGSSASWASLIERHLVPRVHSAVVCGMQVCHDTSVNYKQLESTGHDECFIEAFKDRARHVAHKFGLNATALD